MSSREYREWMYRENIGHHVWAGPDWWTCACGEFADDLIGPEVAEQTAAHGDVVVRVAVSGRAVQLVAETGYRDDLHEWLWANPQYQ